MNLIGSMGDDWEGTVFLGGLEAFLHIHLDNREASSAAESIEIACRVQQAPLGNWVGSIPESQVLLCSFVLCFLVQTELVDLLVGGLLNNNVSRILACGGVGRRFSLGLRVTSKCPNMPRQLLIRLGTPLSEIN